MRAISIPRGASILPNPDGTAPGFVCPVDRGGMGAGYVASMPGVPREMRKMAETALLPWLAAQAGHVLGVRAKQVAPLVFVGR